MCGIYASTDLTTFEVLEQANRARGNFSTGILHIHKNTTCSINKYQGGVDWIETKLPYDKEGGYIYLGHNQAPTSSVRDWKDETSHPFWNGDWVVAHNGVLTNFDELIYDYIEWHDIPVDSSIIPALLDDYEYRFGPCNDVESEIKNIEFVTDKLKGTFAIWIVNMKTKNVYIARQGSTLFYKNTNISSIKGEGYKEVKEGVIYAYTTEGLVEKGTFTTKSPFFTL